MAKDKSLINLLFLYEAHGDLPAEVSLTRCSLEFFDEKRSPGLITGVYGTKSKQVALESLARWNAQHAATPEMRAKGAKSAKLLMIDAQFSVDSLEAQRSRASAESVATSGWLNLDRITPAMRDELKHAWLTSIARSQGAERASQLQDENLVRLATDYPQFVPNLFKKNDRLLGVLHPVRPKFDPQVILWAATVRMLPQRFSDVTARFVPVSVRVD